MEGTGLHFEEHDPFHLLNWPDPLIEWSDDELVSPMVQPGGSYINAGRQFDGKATMPSMGGLCAFYSLGFTIVAFVLVNSGIRRTGGNFINTSYPGVQQAHSEPYVCDTNELPILLYSFTHNTAQRHYMQIRLHHRRLSE